MGYLVYMKNDFCLTGKEYFGDSDGMVIGYHDPHLATIFKTKEEAEDFIKTFDMSAVKIAEPGPHFKAFDKCKFIYRKIPKVNKEHSRKYNHETPVEVLEWWKAYKTLPDKSVSYDDYRTWPHLYQLFSHLWDLCGYHSKDFKKTYKSCQIRTTKDARFEDFKKEFLLVVDYCDYVNEDGYKAFPIFDHELSQYESRYFLYKSEDDCRIGSSGYSRTEHGTMEECFNIMRKDYWYE